MPILLLDTFTDTDGTDLTAHTPEVGPAWTATATQFVITSNKLNFVPIATTSQAVNDPGQPDFELRAHFEMRAGVQTNGVVSLRWVDANNNIRFSLAKPAGSNKLATITVIKIVAGVQTTIGTIGGIASDGDVKLLVIKVKGNVFSVVWGDGTLRFTEAAHAGTTKVAIWASQGVSSSRQAYTLDFLVLTLEEPNVITLKTGQWNVHREGMAEILKAFGQVLCDGTALAITGEIRLWTSANAPGCADNAADYTQATFSGYGAKVIDSGDGGCTGLLEIGVDSDGKGQIVVDQQAWTVANPATIGETVNGAYLVIKDGSSTLLLGTFLFDDPVAMDVAGNILKVAGNLLFDCQMVPVA